MAKFCLLTVLCIAAVVLAGEKDKNFLNDGRAHAKLIRLEESAHNLAAAYRHLVVDTSISKARLFYCANEALRTIGSVIYELNPGVASNKNQVLGDNQCKLVESLSEISNNIQDHLCGDSDKLKDELANACDKICEATRKISKDIETHDCTNELYLINQFRQILNKALYTAQKVKLEIDFGKKTNKELVVEIDAALETFCKCLQNLKGDDHKTKEELIYLIQNLQRILELDAIILEKFVHINEGDSKNCGIAQEVSKALSLFSDSLHQLSSGDHDVTHIKTEFEKLYKATTNVIKKLGDIGVGETTRGDLLIRSVLFGNIAVSKVYERELSPAIAHLSSVKTTKS